MESRDYLEISFRSINCFADDGKLDAEELESLIQIAQRDGEVDENEKRVLRNIVSKIKESEIDDALLLKIQYLESIIGEPV